MHLYSDNDAATLELGRRLAPLLRPGQTVALHGDLGAGKTVLSRGIARGLGVTEPVTSPTFTIVQEYPLPNGNALYHLDMYRLDDAHAALAFGVDEFLFAAHAITLVEWPERIAPILNSPDRIDITIVHQSPTCRRLTLPDALGEPLCRAGLPDGLTRADAASTPACP